MKNIFVLLVLIAACLSGAMICYGTILKSDVGPSIQYAAETNIGTGEIGQEKVVEFELRNVGKGDLIITNLKTDCSCSNVEIDLGNGFEPIDGLTIGTSAKKTVRLKISVRGEGGKGKTHELIFRTNDPRNPVCKMLFVMPEIIGISFRPTDLIMNYNEWELLKTAKVDVFYRGIEEIQSVEIENVNAAILDARFISVTDGEKIGVVEVTPKDWLEGSVRAQLGLKYKKMSGIVEKKVDVLITKRRSIEVSPEKMYLPILVGEKKVFRSKISFRMNKPGVCDIKISKIPTSEIGVREIAASKRSDQAVFEVEFNNNQPKPGNYKLLFSFLDNGAPKEIAYVVVVE